MLIGPTAPRASHGMRTSACCVQQGTHSAANEIASGHLVGTRTADPDGRESLAALISRDVISDGIGELG